MKRLIIPDSEKAKGILWVEYPVCIWEEWWSSSDIIECWEPWGVAEIQIRMERN